MPPSLCQPQSFKNLSTTGRSSDNSWEAFLYHPIYLVTNEIMKHGSTKNKINILLHFKNLKKLSPNKNARMRLSRKVRTNELVCIKDYNLF